jgi:hypothetical protein
VEDISKDGKITLGGDHLRPGLTLTGSVVSAGLVGVRTTGSDIRRSY